MEVFQTNQSSATSNHQSGLNLAFSLGVLTYQEFTSLSYLLGRTTASVALHLDDRGHLRHLFYRDEVESFGHEVTCFEEDSENDKEVLHKIKALKSTIIFWSKVWSRRNVWGVPARAHLLQDVMARLQHFLASSPSPLVSKCLKDLQDCIHLQHVVFFSSSEDQIGSIKYFLTHYVHMVLRKNRGLLLQALSNNKICALFVPGQLWLFNLQTYASAKEDAEFYDKEFWIPQPAIRHHVHTIRHQPRLLDTSKTTVYSPVLLHARRLVFFNLKYWTKFGQDKVSEFGIDVHGN